MIALLIVLLSPGAAPDLTALTAAGRAALEAGDPALARLHFEEALRIKVSPALLLGRARALGARAETCGAARAAFQEFFRECHGCAEHPQAVRARAAALRRCGATLLLTAEPPGAVFEVRGVSVEPPVRTWAGSLRVRARWTGSGARSQSACLAPGEALTVHLSLDGDPRSVPVSPEASEQAAAHTAAAARHRELGAHCAQALELRLAYLAQPEPLLRFRRAVALESDPRRCVEALGEYDAFLAGCRFCGQREEARQRRARLSYRCLGRLTVRAPSGAQVRVDGPPPPHGDARRLPGIYRVSVRAAEALPWRRSVPVEVGTERVLTAILSPRVPPRPVLAPAPRWCKWVALGVGVVGAGLAGYGAAVGEEAGLSAGGLAAGAAGLAVSATLWPWSEGDAEGIDAARGR